MGKVETDEGLKNVKQYYLNAHNIVLEFNPEGVEIKVGVRDRKSIDVTLPYYRSEIPKSNGFVGRRRELEVLRNCEGTTVVWVYAWHRKDHSRISICNEHYGRDARILAPAFTGRQFPIFRN